MLVSSLLILGLYSTHHSHLVQGFRFRIIPYFRLRIPKTAPSSAAHLHLGQVRESPPGITDGIYFPPFTRSARYIYIYIYLYIYIYIYTRFQKGFHIERYIDRYMLLFSCTCARVHFSLVIVQLVKKLGSTMNFLFVRFLVPISREKK